MLVTLTISRNDAGQRADRLVRKLLPKLSLDRMNSLFRRDEIKVVKKPIDRGHLLQEGDEIRIYGLKPEEAERAGETWGAAGPSGIPIAPAVFDLPVIHEDQDLLVVDKPAGLAVHPGTGIEPGQSVIEKVWSRQSGWRVNGEVFRPALVHRLDKDTSGVLLIAKTGPALRDLTAALRGDGFVKRYLALVEGRIKPAEGRFEGNLQRMDSKAGGAKAEVVEDEGKTAVTRYKTAKTIGNFSLLSVIIETGRMHQIRAHLAHAGHPLAGDSRYGSHERNRAYRKGLGLKRIFLHAADLEVRLPGRAKLAFHATLPAELEGALERIPSFGASGTEASASETPAP